MCCKLLFPLEVPRSVSLHHYGSLRGGIVAQGQHSVEGVELVDAVVKGGQGELATQRPEGQVDGVVGKDLRGCG